MKLVNFLKLFSLIIAAICTQSIAANESSLHEPSWQANYVRPEFFGDTERKEIDENSMDIDPFSDEISGFIIEMHHDNSASKLQLMADALIEYAAEQEMPLQKVISGSSSKILYLKKDVRTDNYKYYDQFGKIVTWLMINRQDSVVSVRPILGNKDAYPFDPEKVVWMEPVVVRKVNREIRSPESTIVDGFHIHVDYLPGQATKALALKERFKKEIINKGIIYSALDEYPEKANGPHVRAGWEIKFEKAGPTVFDRYGYALAWLLLNHQNIPVYSHPKTWIYGENEERLISHLDNSLYIGSPPELNQWFFFNPEVNPSGLYRWDAQLPLARTISSQESLSKQTQILNFWFGDELSDYPHIKSKMWFSKQREAKDKEFDKKILETYQKDIVLATMGMYNTWKNTPEGRLALIILLDQLPRNMFRGTPMAFAYDRLSLEIAKKGVEAGDDKKLGYAQRLFFYLPFSHSENLDDQRQGVELQAQLRDEVPEHLKEIFKEHHQMAELHLMTVEKFGRLSSRNQILERESTHEEKEYLNNPGYHF